MIAEDPQITSPTHGRTSQHLWMHVLRASRFAGLAGLIQNQIDLRHREAGKIDLEIQRNQLLQLDGENLAVPAGLFGQAIVCEYIGPALVFAEMRQPNHRHARQAQELGGLEPTMARDDLIVITHQDRISESKALHRSRDLLDLAL